MNDCTRISIALEIIGSKKIGFPRYPITMLPLIASFARYPTQECASPSGPRRLTAPINDYEVCELASYSHAWANPQTCSNNHAV